MSTWEQAKRVRTRSKLTSDFSPEECARLEALRERYRDTHNCAEFGVDVKLLRYMRWMVEHGRFGEGIEETLSNPL